MPAEPEKIDFAPIEIPRVRRSAWGVVKIALVLAVIGGVVAAWQLGYLPRLMGRQARPIFRLVEVDRGDINISVVETGTVESANNATIRCQVEAILGAVGGSQGGTGKAGGAGAGGQAGGAGRRCGRSWRLECRTANDCEGQDDKESWRFKYVKDFHERSKQVNEREFHRFVDNRFLWHVNDCVIGFELIHWSHHDQLEAGDPQFHVRGRSVYAAQTGDDEGG